MGQRGPQVSIARLTRSALLGACIMAAAGCAHRAPAPLYAWGSFPKLQYETLLAGGNGANPAQIAAMEAHIEKARSANAALPPGFRAHLGMLKLAAGDADGARNLWVAEKSAFPESTAYMDQLLTRLDGSPKVATVEKPA